MVMLVFLNKYDKQSIELGSSVPEYLRGDYVKIYTRYENEIYESCDVKNTISKLKEYAIIFDRLIISFGFRLFPLTAYKQIIKDNNNSTNNIVFLKKLKGSKTWSISSDNKLKFDNYRIADTGLFILNAKDIIETTHNNFNYFLHDLIDKNKLEYRYIPFWVTTNKYTKNKE